MSVTIHSSELEIMPIYETFTFLRCTTALNRQPIVILLPPTSLETLW